MITPNLRLYDGINRLVEVKDAYNTIIQQLIYNDANAQESSYDALGNEMKFHYDRNLRQTGQTDGEGNRTYITYDYRGNINSNKDENGNTTSYAYDGENRLVGVTDAMGNRTMYSYDGNGNLISQTDGNGNTTTYTYNAANLLTARIDPKGNGSPDKTETYTYLANGLMATKTDRNAVLTSYTYDIFGRLLSEDVGGQVQTYSYDDNGNLLTMTDVSGTTVRTYDGLNRNTSKTVPGIGESTYKYDIPTGEAGEYAERTTDPLGNTNIKTYDKVGRLLTVLAEDDNPTIYSYYPNGSRHKITYPDGTEQTYTYDRKNQILSLTNERGNGSIISSYSYTYDGAGNQLTKTDTSGTTRYTYDSLNRLSTVTEPEGKQTSYSYDGAGNRSTETVKLGEGSVTTTYLYNPQNRLTATISTSGEETKYIYDNNGNLLTKASGVSLLKTIQEGDGKDSLPSYDLIIRKGDMVGTGSKDLSFYSYDNYNRLISQRAESTTSTYKYNAQGYRVEKSVNGETTKYLYEYDKVVLETDGDNKQTALNVYGSSLLYRETKVSGGTGTEGYYYIYNAHGDVTSLIDKSGNIAASYDYDAFGNILSETGTADNPIRYAGYQYDIESGLYYLNARYYDSKIARFITEDTYRGQMDDPLSLNLYTYCANNPIVYWDPSGHEYIKKYNGSYWYETWEDDYYFRYDGSEFREYIRTEEYNGPLDAYKAMSDNYQITSLKNTNFVTITDGTTYYYGGNQDWYTEYTQSYGGCGPTAAANVVAYMAQENADLKELYDYNMLSISQSDFKSFMDEMYEYVKPREIPIFSYLSNEEGKAIGLPSIGVFPAYKLVKGIIDYANSKKIDLKANTTSSTASFDYMVDFIREGLEKNSPVAVLNVFNPVNMEYTSSITGNVSDKTFDQHWVTITKMSENKTTGQVILEVSTWGGKATIDFNELYNSKGIFGEISLVYFEQGKESDLIIPMM